MLRYGVFFKLPLFTFSMVSVFLLFLLASIAALFMQRRIYALRNYVTQALCFDDLIILAAAVLLLSALVNSGMPILFGFALGLWLFWVVMLWLDALLLHLYGFEMNISNIVTALQGAQAFNGEWGAIFRTFAKRHWFLALPLFALSVAGGFSVAPGSGWSHGFWAAALVLFLFGAIKAKISVLAAVIWLALAGVMFYLIVWLTSWWPVLSNWWLFGFFGIALALYFLRRKFSGHFWRSTSMLRYFLVGEKLKPAAGVTIKPEHQSLLHPQRAHFQRSSQRGLCEGANIILITLESLARDFCASYVANTAEMSYFKKLAQTGIFSNNHFTCSPNTNRAIEHIYQADYPGQGDYQLFNTLKSAGYQSGYMMISKTKYFELNKILEEIGFDYIWDKDSEGFAHQRGDYSFIDSVDTIARAFGNNKFFLHLKSEQTHSPYQVVNRQRFNRFDDESRESRYMNAMEESDFVIEQFIAALAEKMDLSNTIIIFTGDHGQSFGQFGYTSHSNSTVRQQTLVPFVLSHPKLSAHIIEESSHFDLLPTVLDLLDIPSPRECFGQNLLNISERPLLLYSQTRKANAPSNTSLLLNQQKIMLDLVYGYRYVLNRDDEILATMTTEQERYFRTLLYQMLDTRGLISDSLFIPRAKTRPD